MRNMTVATFVTLLVLSMTVGSGHVVLAHNDKYTRDFSNSGNNQETQQDCGNSCTQTSSNTVSSGSSGLTTPSPSPSPTPTTLTLDATIDQSTGTTTLTGKLTGATGFGIEGATITFTKQSAPVITDPSTVVTDDGGSYLATTQNLETFDNITAQYAGGAPTLATSTTSAVLPPLGSTSTVHSHLR